VDPVDPDPDPQLCLYVTSLSRIFSQDQVRRLRELSGLRMPYMRPSVRAVIDPETLEEAVLSAVIKHLALGTAAARQSTLIKKKRKFYIRKFRNGAVAKSYMRKGFLIFEEMH
jgi:hypothetical protein